MELESVLVLELVDVDVDDDILKTESTELLTLGDVKVPLR